MNLKAYFKEYMGVRYWVHVGIIALVVLGILQIWQGGEMLTLTNWAYSVPLIAIGDIISDKITGY